MKLNTATFLPVVCLLCQTGAATPKTLPFDPVDSTRDRTVPLKIYLPEKEGASPVILFSHGLGGSRENNPYLGNHWAENGYACIFMQHPGSDEEVWKSAKFGQKFQALKDAAGLRQTLDRFADVPFVLDQLEKWVMEEGHPLQGKLDFSKTGLCGHSHGAVTTMGLAGQKFPSPKTFHDKRISAFLTMSPNPIKGLSPEKAYGHLRVPILCMTGTNDGSPIDPGLQPESRRKVYEAFPNGDKYQLVLDGAYHHAFGDSQRKLKSARKPNHHPAILKVSTKFWDAYLKGDTEAKALLQSNDVPKDSGLGDVDVWEWK